MDKPIFEIPMTPADGSGSDDGLGGWAPSRVTPTDADRPTFESLLAELAEQSATPLPTANPVFPPSSPAGPAGPPSGLPVTQLAPPAVSSVSPLAPPTAAPAYAPDPAPYLIPIPQTALRQPAGGASLAESTDVEPPAFTEPPVETVAFAVQVEAASEFPPQAAAVLRPSRAGEETDRPLGRTVASGRRAAAPLVPEAEAPRVFVPVEHDAALTEEELAAVNPADPELLFALEEVVLQHASDLHVTVGAPPSLRIDGALQPLIGAQKWSRERVEAALYSLLSDEQIVRFEREHELDFAYAAGGARFRVNFYLQRGSVGGAFRLIPRDIKPLADLGVPASVSRFATLPRGLVLVTGPTGSGKSTTLAALIDLVNRTRADHIVTVEDPIEFLHQHQMALVNQREVGHDTHSFAAALKHVLRQDPDVILIGELRDLETISVALTAAETGHLVFATLHTQDAAQTIDRVIDVFPPHQQGQVRAQLAATLQGVICQTLVKKAHGRGRVVATEVLVTTPAIGNLIREGKTYQITSMMQAGGALGMHTMDQHLADLVNSGQITRRSAQEKAHDAEGIARLINRIESPTEASAQAFAATDIDFGDSYSGVVR
ncbi:PilT/PilU family type 4a pilus ATPase [Glaciibacter psychrotolerans]|uniref:Twitching motility protein PilT n=1 Tax=Glaciibacter psychrotolerans TaxID=670054 RepID=A0A7Z0J7E9_9MICO|nr:PilT/PilU family type 4a pilus ATPase [Leifsonia psychrotolerans]NYJ21532.1 twitching motility protein PilT [Leifsonia psychrotolerans]